MNRVPVIVRNPAYIEEVELDGDEVVPANIIPLISGDSPLPLSQPRRMRT